MRPHLILFAGVLPLAAANARIDYVTYLGGAFTDRAVAVAVDGAGNPIVAGTTSSPDFPLTSSALGSPAKGSCAFLTKLNDNGTAIQWSVCLQNLDATAMRVDAAGDIYLLAVNGTTLASNVVKLNADAGAVLWTATAPLSSEALALDADGNVYVAGAATDDLSSTPGAFQRQLTPGACPALHPTFTSPCPDAFVMKLSRLGQTLLATYLGGGGADAAHAIAVDGAGNIWVGGETVSAGFPVTPDALQRTFHGEIDLGPLQFGDGFVTKLDPTGSKLLYSTYLGGSAPDAVRAMAIDATNSVYVTGGTQSADFPVTPGALHAALASVPTPSTPGLTFVSKFDPVGKLLFSAAFSARATEGVSIAVDSNYEPLIGESSGPGDALPAVFGSPPSCTRQSPGVIRIAADASAITGSALVSGGTVALDASGRVYVAGVSYSLAFVATPGAFQTEYQGGDSDAFAARVDFSRAQAVMLSCMLNAATLLPGNPSSNPRGDVAPGEIVSLFGTGFGAGSTVSFDGLPAPILYTSDTQINAVVPFGVFGPVTFATVFTSGNSWGPVRLPVADAVPGIFQTDAGPFGSAAALNQDGTVNSASNRAEAGTAVALFLTGLGRWNMNEPDGSLGPLAPPFPSPVLGVSAQVNGVEAPVLFAGQAPGLVMGAAQVNILIPENSRNGTGYVSIYVGNYVAQSQLWVK